MHVQGSVEETENLSQTSRSLSGELKATLGDFLQRQAVLKTQS